MKTLAATFALVFSLGIAACATISPPPELVDARAAYARAYEGPAAKVDVAGLHEARRALDAAEAKFADDPGSEESRHLAYLAHREILLVETNARVTLARKDRTKAAQARR